MPYAILERKIKSLPEEAFVRVSQYVDEMCEIYKKNRLSYSLQKIREKYSDVKDDGAFQDVLEHIKGNGENKFQKSSQEIFGEL